MWRNGLAFIRRLGAICGPGPLSEPYMLYDTRNYDGTTLPNDGTGGSQWDLPVASQNAIWGGDNYLLWGGRLISPAPEASNLDWAELCAHDAPNLHSPDTGFTTMFAMADIVGNLAGSGAPAIHTDSLAQWAQFDGDDNFTFEPWRASATNGPSDSAPLFQFVLRNDNSTISGNNWIDFSIFNTFTPGGGNTGGLDVVNNKMVTVYTDLSCQKLMIWLDDVLYVSYPDDPPVTSFVGPTPAGDTANQWTDAESKGTTLNLEPTPDYNPAPTMPLVTEVIQVGYHATDDPSSGPTPGSFWNGIRGVAAFCGKPTDADIATWKSYFYP